MLGGYMKKLDIIFEDKELLVVNKPSRLLTISDGKTDYTLYHMAREYVKKQHPSNKIFIVHRLDRDTSGIVLFAKNEVLKNALQKEWNVVAKREYIAILEGKLEQKKGVIQEYLQEDKTHHVYASKNKKGEYAETRYEVIHYTKSYTIVRVNIVTGKKNQIRVGFANLGHPIIGDKKYGSKSNPIGRLGLHAFFLSMKIKGKNYVFETKIPKEFLKFGKNELTFPLGNRLN